MKHPTPRSTAVAAACIAVGALAIGVYLALQFSAAPKAPQAKSEDTSNPPLPRPVAEARPHAPMPAASGAAATAAGVAKAVSGASADWKRVTAAMPLAEVLDAAQRSPRPDDRRSAGWTYAICATTLEPPMVEVRDLVHFHFPDADGASPAVVRAVASVAAARERLAGFCEPLKSKAVLDAANRVAARARHETSVTGTARGMPGAARAGEWSQEQTQAAILALSNPAEHALAVDRLLESVVRLPAGLGAESLTAHERLEARSLAYQELTGDHNPDSVRNLFACMNSAACIAGIGAQPSVAANARVVAVAWGLVEAIRTQRWSDLGL